ncbi:MAG: hypothetical protein NTX00_04030 [Candidatus Parcubacteria bacterium]|nr:hypothetical protein [Candidatus Parcubacteria bacterium]
MEGLWLEWRDGCVKIRKVTSVGIPISGVPEISTISPTKDGIKISGFDPKKVEIKQTDKEIAIKLL